MRQQVKTKPPGSFWEYALSLTLYTLGFEEGLKGFEEELKKYESR